MIVDQRREQGGTMADNLQEFRDTIIPYLYYEDVAGALEWITRVFGFKERHRMTRSDGNVNHAEMTFNNGLIMMGDPGPDYKNPKRLGHLTQTLYVYVPDVDAHFQRTTESGAKIIQQLEDQPYGDRTYGAEDLEGHTWYFAQPLKRS
jgi:PhnB protein